MKVLAVDSDPAALGQLEAGLRTVFVNGEVKPFDNALKSYRYVVEHKENVALIYFPLTMKPFDGFKYAELLEQAGYRGELIFTTRNDNEEMRELIRLNGGNRFVEKPVTPDKIHGLAVLEQELCLDRTELDSSGVSNHEYTEKCVGCIYHWCRKYREQEPACQPDGLNRPLEKERER